MDQNIPVYKAIRECLEHGKKGALATIVQVYGSAYRRAGAKMFIDETGQTIGLISGGCLEADVAQVAIKVMEDGKAILKHYNLDEDLVWGLGLGCPGEVDIYIEALTHHPALVAWLQAIEHQDKGLLATMIDAKPVHHFINEKGEIVGSLNDGMIQQAFITITKQKLQQKIAEPEMRKFGDEINVFIDVYIPPIELMIFGAGHDAIPLATYSRSLGITTTIVDARTGYNTAERFPGAERIITGGTNLAEKVSIGMQTYIIVMNHHLEKDAQTLAFVLPSAATYVGLLGPKSRQQRILHQLSEEGIHFTDQEWQKCIVQLD